MKDEDDKLKDSDEISYEYFFDENFKQFTIIVSAPKSLEVTHLAACLIDFATGIEAGDIALFASDEVTMH